MRCFAVRIMAGMLLMGCGAWVACGGNDNNTGPTNPANAPVIQSFAPSADTIGATVIITGSRFSVVRSENIVRFGSAVAEVTMASSKELAVVLPRGACSGPISVTVNGVPGSSIDSFSVLMIPIDAPTASYSDVCWTGDLFVAVGSSGRIATSTDGRVWTARASSTSNTLTSVVHTGGTTVAVGLNSTLVYSTNGTSWTKPASPAPATASFVSVAASNNRFVAVPAQAAYAVSSSDGLSWERYDFDTSLTVTCVDWVGKFQAYADNLWIAYSYDGMIWSRVRSNLILPPVLSTAWSGSRSLLVKPSALFWMSGGFLWSDVTPGAVLEQAYSDIYWSGTDFMVAGDQFVLASPDGGTWRKIADYDRSSGVAPRIAANDSVCVVVGSFTDNKILVWEY